MELHNILGLFSNQVLLCCITAWFVAQALHAKTLGFVHPSTGEEMFFDSEIPADMTALIDKWRVYATTKEL